MRSLKALLSAALLLVAPLSGYLALPAAVMVASAPLIPQSAHAASFFFARSGSVVPPTGDGFFSPAGSDAVGNVIGTDCILATPCKTPTKMLAFVKANIVAHPNIHVRMDSANGPFFITSPILWTPDQTGTGTALWDAYGNAGNAVISGGNDLAGTWGVAGSFGSSVALPSGAAACASNYYVSQAPLTGTKRNLYVGVLWVTQSNGVVRQVNEVQNPRIGLATNAGWAQVPGTAGGAAVGASVDVNTTATLTGGNSTIAIGDASQIGNPGQIISFETTVGNIAARTTYWLLSVSAVSGPANITISTSPGGSVRTPSTSGSTHTTDQVQSVNAGDRGSTPNTMNELPYDATNAPFVSSYNQTDVKGELPYQPSIVPVSSVHTTGTCVGGTAAPCVTLNTRTLKGAGGTIYPGTGYRVRDRFEDLGGAVPGGGGATYTGEMYHDRTTGYIYMTVRADLGETCAGLNAAGTVYAPGALEQLIRFSNASNDTSNTGKNAGNVTLQNITLSHANTAFLTGDHAMQGDAGGAVAVESSHITGSQNWAMGMIGAKNVTLGGGSGLGVKFLYNAGSAVQLVGCGSNNITMSFGEIGYAGGDAANMGAELASIGSFYCNTDPTLYGTGIYGTTTTSYNTGGGATNVDLTGASDCCLLIDRMNIHDTGTIFTGENAVGISAGQSITISNTVIHEHPDFGLTTTTNGVSGVANSPDWVAQAGSSGNFPIHDINLNHLEVYHGGYQTVSAYGGVQAPGTPIPGSAAPTDFSGCFYMRGPHDGPGDGSVGGLTLEFNKMHDCAAGTPAEPTGTGAGQPRSFGIDGILDYHDGNNACGVLEDHNLFYNSATVSGLTQYLTRLRQHTGNCRSKVYNNIWWATFPAGSATSNTNGNFGYLPEADVVMFGEVWAASKSFSALSYVWNAGNYYQTTAGGTSGGSPPTCGSGSCSDGGVTWNFGGVLPAGQFSAYWKQDYSNIVAYAVAGSSPGTTADVVALSGFMVNPQFGQYGGTGIGNFYAKVGSNLNNICTSPTTSFTSWQASTGPAGFLEDLQSQWSSSASNWFPNFTNADAGNFTMQSSYTGEGTASACVGGGVSPACPSFGPWNYNAVGP